MCGRMNVDEDVLADTFESLFDVPFPGASNHNTAPTETAWIVRNRRRSPQQADAGLEAAPATWWLTPYWSPTPKPRYATFNAKAETLAESRVFREPFRRRRCVVPVAGFYEWRRRGDLRQPFHVHSQSGALLLGGVWDRWRARDGSTTVESFAVVTTAASAELEFLHDRQPLMLSPEGAMRWLDRDTSASALARLLQPRLPDGLTASPVSDYVGDPRNKGPRCAVPSGPAIAVGGQCPGDDQGKQSDQGELL